MDWAASALFKATSLAVSTGAGEGLGLAVGAGVDTLVVAVGAAEGVGVPVCSVQPTTNRASATNTPMTRLCLKYLINHSSNLTDVIFRVYFRCGRRSTGTRQNGERL